ncbi:MAG: hypothetical protein ABSB35_28050 [Bryobacteraceae bacterium]
MTSTPFDYTIEIGVVDMVRAILSITAVLIAVGPVKGQAPVYKAPRTADGKPDLNGIWQVINAANWDIEDHSAAPGPLSALGAAGAIPPGQGVVEGGAIPYKPEAAAKKKENFANRLTADPEIKCYLPGVPRATYIPQPFQIIQSPKSIMIAYQYAGAVRTIPLDNPGPSPSPTWMGWSVGHWEGETLVVDVTSFNDQTWFDRAGNFHSDALHVVERYTARSPDTLIYEATIEDPNVFARPWKMSMPLYRRVEKNAQLLEFRCVEFSEEMLYGDLRKKASK